MNRLTTCFSLSLLAAVSALASSGSAAPIYNITSLSPDAVSGDSSSGTGISSSGTYIAGWKTSPSGNTGFVRTEAGGTIDLPELSGGSNPYVQPAAANNNGVVVGTGYATAFRSGALPLIWEDTSTVAQLPLPTGYGAGKANAINDSGMAVGVAIGDIHELATTFTTTEATILTQTMPNGGLLQEAFGINNGGQIVGVALDPDNTASTRAFSLTPGSQYATDLGNLPGHDSAIAFGVSENGYVVGNSAPLGGASSPFIWSVTSGMVEIPKNGYENGTAMAVNSDGWVVGDMSSLTSVIFLYDGKETYLLNDLIPAGSGWDLVGGTSNAALGISEDGVITGRGLLNGEITGFVMTPVPEPNLTVLLFGALLSCLWIRRR